MVSRTISTLDRLEKLFAIGRGIRLCHTLEETPITSQPAAFACPLSTASSETACSLPWDSARQKASGEREHERAICSRSIIRSFALGAPLVLWLIGPVSCWGQGLTPVAAPREPSPIAVPFIAPDEQAAPPLDVVRPGDLGVVVLLDGRIFDGRLSETPGGYRIDGQSGAVTVPGDQVKVIAHSLEDAYQRLRNSLRQPVAGDHLQLAEWCRRNKLWTQARDEAMAALTLEPLRSDARGLLWQINEQLTAQELAANPVPTVEVIAVPNEERTSNGLSKDSLALYIRQLQPLMKNKCGNARCHGTSSQNGFILSGVRSSSSNFRLPSEQNLEAVLKFIDLESPALSPILTKPGELTDSHRAVFTGFKGQEHRKLLTDWVLRVAAEQRSLDPKFLARQRQVNRSEPGLLISPKNSGDMTPLPADEGADELPGTDLVLQAGALEPQPPSIHTIDQATLDALVRERQPDLFDPEVFNKLMHGDGAKSRFPAAE